MKWKHILQVSVCVLCWSQLATDFTNIEAYYAEADAILELLLLYWMKERVDSFGSKNSNDH